MDNWVKAVIGIGAVGGVVYLGTKFLNPGPPGGSCVQPGTPCYSALQPYINTYTICAQQYSTLLDGYVRQNSQAGTAFTSNQLANLDYLKTCMDNAATAIGATSQQYTPPSIPGLLATNVGYAIIAGVSVLAVGSVAAKIISARQVGAVARFSGTAQSDIDNAVIRALSQQGIISPASSAAMKPQLDARAQVNISAESIAAQNAALSRILTADEAAAIVSDAQVNVAADYSITKSELP